MIRQAKLADFGSIIRIRESVRLDIARLDNPGYRVRVQRDGFLLSIGLTVEDFQASLSEYIVAEQDGRVVGYLRLTEAQDVPPETPAFWFNSDLREVYYSSLHAYIYGVGVLPEAKHRGVATEMLRAAERLAKARRASWLFSEIVTSPVTNVASLLFHEKNGFERVALVEPTSVHGMEGFQNLLYGKQL